MSTVFSEHRAGLRLSHWTSLDKRRALAFVMSDRRNKCHLAHCTALIDTKVRSSHTRATLRSLVVFEGHALSHLDSKTTNQRSEDEPTLRRREEGRITRWEGVKATTQGRDVRPPRGGEGTLHQQIEEGQVIVRSRVLPSWKRSQVNDERYDIFSTRSPIKDLEWLWSAERNCHFSKGSEPCYFLYVHPCAEESWNLTRCAGDHPQGQWDNNYFTTSRQERSMRTPNLARCPQCSKKNFDKGLKEHAHQRQ